MFTVIFADRKTIKLFEETKMFFGPLYDTDKMAFCEWHTEENDFESMVPGLYELIEHRTEWRALVLWEGVAGQANPFDYVGYDELSRTNENRDWNFYKARREKRLCAYNSAVSNPLLKLTVALCGLPTFRSVLTEEEAEKIRSGATMPYVFMLKRQLELLNCSETAARIATFRREEAKRFVPEEAIETLTESIRTKNTAELLRLIPADGISDFIRFIGNDPIFSDPEYMELLIENTERARLLRAVYACFRMRDKLPSDILCMAPRTFDFETVLQDIKWMKKDENNSSKFARYNLYSEKLKFVLFDTAEKSDRRFELDRVKLLCLLLVMAGNEAPRGLIGTGNVYRARIDFDTEAATKICERYISKLKSTKHYIRELGLQTVSAKENSVDSRTAQTLFESDVHIPVSISSEYDRKDLCAKFGGIGLATDCPQDEYTYWAGQYRDIHKSFVRYLREPRRAVKFAVTDTFPKRNCIRDDRTLLLDENQSEDVKIHLDETEQKMIDSATANLFNTARYTEQLNEADKEVRREIRKRMTGKKTAVIGLTAVGAYLFGFLPLIFDNCNTTRSLLFSLLTVAVMTGAFCLCGFLCLFVLREKLINRFKHFNYVMSGILGDINGGLERFSDYISCVCNVMRDFSVLQNHESAAERTGKILACHDAVIACRLERVHEIFSRYVDFGSITPCECDPYDYDFTVSCRYEYDIPDLNSHKKITYLQQGNDIVLPIEYVESIMLTREEFYDG